MKAAGNDVQGMFSNDIVGASQAWDGTQPDPHTVRLFLEGIPTAVTNAQISLMQSVGGENDGLARQLGRFAQDAAPFDLTGMNIRIIWRRDRYLRGSDHVSFPGGEGQRRGPVGAGDRAGHAQERADPHRAAGHLRRHQPDDP
jgi:hypothetical protein